MKHTLLEVDKYLESVRSLANRTFVFHKYPIEDTRKQMQFEFIKLGEQPIRANRVITDLYIWSDRNSFGYLFTTPNKRQWIRVAIDSTGGTDFLGQRDAYRKAGICTMVVKRKLSFKGEN